jgi:predicted porin
MKTQGFAKKSLIALAVVGAFSGSAFAADSVQLYGIIDMGVGHFTGIAPSNTTAAPGSTASYTGLMSGVVAGSRIGLKGSEDLGGGLKAIFKAETGFCPAGTNQTGAGTSGYCTGGSFMGRAGLLGLQGSFGTVQMGRYFTSMFTNEINYDPFQAGFTGAYSNFSLGIYGFDGKAVGSLLRSNQTITYISPSLAGLTVRGDYSFNTGAATAPINTAGNKPTLLSLDGNYAFGNVATVGANYTKVNNLTGANSDGAYKVWQLFGSYNVGLANLMAIYERGTADFYSGHDSSWLIGANAPVGAGNVMVSYGQYGNSLSATGTSMSTSTAKQYAIGYSYNLSKRTMLYTSYAHINNDAAAANRVGTALAVNTATNGNSGVVGQGSSGFAVGILHSF